jgi:uncharacterized protein YdeI (YjbR/CyaY-like superfamily)
VGSADPIFFASPAELRAWLEEHHDSATELLVGFHKKDTGRPTLSWSESVDQALCFGWIDNVRRSLGDDAYTIRFTPRKPNSTWSNINVAKVADLTAAGLMRPAGIAAFQRRRADRTGIYSFEGNAGELTPHEIDEFRRHADAWRWFEQQPPGYRRAAGHGVASAKRDATRASRLKTLIADSAEGVRVKPLRRRGD